MRVATLLFFGLVTFLVGEIALAALAPIEAIRAVSGGRSNLDDFQLASMATYLGSGLFMLLAGLELLYTLVARPFPGSRGDAADSGHGRP